MSENSDCIITHSRVSIEGSNKYCNDSEIRRWFGNIYTQLIPRDMRKNVIMIIFAL